MDMPSTGLRNSFVPKGWNIWRDGSGGTARFLRRKVQSGFAENTYRGRDGSVYYPEEVIEEVRTRNDIRGHRVPVCEFKEKGRKLFRIVPVS